MSAYSIIVALHVIVAVLGVGQFGALAVLTMSRTCRPATLLALAAPTQLSLVLMLLTGTALVTWTRAVFLSAWWLRISLVLAALLGVFNVRVKQRLRLLAVSGANIDETRRLAPVTCFMCGVVAIIVYLMVIKPW
jgi:hypothetical protein